MDFQLNNSEEIKKQNTNKINNEIIRISSNELFIKEFNLDPTMFDSKGDKTSGWSIGKKRGPPKQLLDYDPPLGWIGYGLNVTGKYDNGDNTWLGNKNVEGEWYIAYHGTGGSNNIIKKIIEDGFKTGLVQIKKDVENENPLSNKEFKYCGEGVFCTNSIDYAEAYSAWKGGIEFEGKTYKIVFMCRVNPYKVRFTNLSYEWIVSGDKIDSSKSRRYDDEIRPYRILLKEF